MKSDKRTERNERCSESSEESEMPRFQKTGVQVTATGKYQCRYCGLLFDTLEAHDRHYRKVHGLSQAYLSTINQS